MMHDRTGYTPYVGRSVRGWPETVLLRGEVLVESGAFKGKPGSGQFLPRTGGRAAEPLGRAVPEMDPAQNFGPVLF
jgi:dihydropyrimidinase